VGAVLLNSDINVDLHIHSRASSYKEPAGLLESCGEENVDVLLGRLNDCEINVFSITDHNRFDASLYRTFRGAINEGKYANVKCIMPGVEFNVAFDDRHPDCHVIAIFDTKDSDGNLDAIATAIGSRLLGKKDVYPIAEFEQLLREIGLATILIAHQQQGLLNDGTKPRSLSSSTEDAISFIKYGYIDSLEYNKPRVQGILLSEMKDLGLKGSTIAGSDCHDWAAYPARKSGEEPRADYKSRIRALPTFKGLALSLSSPETRFDQPPIRCRDCFVRTLTVGNQVVEFSPGVNAVIGENGVGKSSLLELLTSEKPVKHVGDIQKKNGIFFDKKLQGERVEYIKQGGLQSKHENREKKDGGIFASSFFPDVDNSAFEAAVRAYTNEMIRRVEKNIKYKLDKEKLKEVSVRLNVDLEGDTYYFQISVPEDFTEIDNPHSEHERSLKLISDTLAGELASQYYAANQAESEALLEAKDLIDRVLHEVREKSTEVELERKIKNGISAAAQNYKTNLFGTQTAADQEKNSYRDAKNSVISSIGAVVGDVCEGARQGDIPCIHLPDECGARETLKKGFRFLTKTVYADDPSVENSLLDSVMTTGFKTPAELLLIDTAADAEKAIKSHKAGSWRDRWLECMEDFIVAQERTTRTISVNRNQHVGSTLGEMSLAYFQYRAGSNADIDVLIADQPEDNISNQRIHSYLIDFFNQMRGKKQIIFVTHNPLLVVNQDVDNVIVLEEGPGETIEVNSGCLESGDILDKVAEIMDGGREAVERRLRAYGKVD
jgi:predicted ATPase